MVQVFFLKSRGLNMEHAIFDKNDSKDFLLAEYRECFNHMRHYDSVEVDFVKFSFSGYLALIGGSFALFQYLINNSLRGLCISGLLFFGFLAGIILLAFAVRNRSYYVIVTCQVNSIRKYFLENSEIEFIKHNKCYLDPTKPKNFNPKSTYTFLILLIVLFNSLILSGALFFAGRQIFGKSLNIYFCILGLILVLVTLFLQIKCSIDYLKKRDLKTADEAIFK